MKKHKNFIQAYLGLFFCLGLVSCAHGPKGLWDVPKKSKVVSRVRSAAPVPELVETQELTQELEDTNWENVRSVQNALMIQNGKLIVEGVTLKNTQFDIPITVNSRVGYWVDYFCNRGRSHFEKYLERSEYFIPYIVPILKKHGLPEDLVFLAMIESGFNNLARSRAKAVGPWQFIPGTGRRYGLRVNWWVDERRDTEKATLAAVGYLKDLYGLFQSWELAAAAYNAGEHKIERAIQRFGSKDFWVLSRHRFLKPETRDYVPKIIAAAMIAKNRVQFGFPEKYVTQTEAGEVLASDGEIVKLEKTDQPVADSAYQEEKEADLKELALAPRLVEESAKSPILKRIPAPMVSRSGKVSGEELSDFEVQSPADLLKIARAAGLSYQTVKALNPEILRWCTPPTTLTYRIKLPTFAREQFLATYNHEAYPRKVQFMTYQVHRGDTLTRIARIFGIRVDPMQDLNRVHPRTLLKKGAKVLLPMPNDRMRTFASLEVYDFPERSRLRSSGSRNRRKSSLKMRFSHRKKSAVDVVFVGSKVRRDFSRKS